MSCYLLFYFTIGTGIAAFLLWIINDATWCVLANSNKETQKKGRLLGSAWSHSSVGYSIALGKRGPGIDVTRNYASMNDIHRTCRESIRVRESHPGDVFFFSFFSSSIAVLDCCVRCSNKVDIQSKRQKT